MKTYAPKPRDIERRWYVVDADGAVLGRLASEVAAILRGKHKPIFAPHADTGDHVVVVNARGIRVTGGKEEKKIAYRHSGYPGGLTETKYGRLMQERPSFVIEKAVKGMLPHNRLGRSMATKLAVYDGPDHPHAAQKPQPLKLGEIPKWSGLPVAAPVPARVHKEEVAERKRTPARSTSTRAAEGTKPAAKPKATAKRAAKPKAAAKRAAVKRKTVAKKAEAKKAAAKKPSRRKTEKKDG